MTKLEPGDDFKGGRIGQHGTPLCVHYVARVRLSIRARDSVDQMNQNGAAGGGTHVDMLAAATGTPVALRSHWRPTRRDWTSFGCCACRPAPAVDEAKKVAVVVVAMEVRAEAARSLAAAAAMRRMQRMQR